MERIILIAAYYGIMLLVSHLLWDEDPYKSALSYSLIVLWVAAVAGIIWFISIG